MRLCFISNYNGRLDDGMINVAFHLCRELSNHHKVLHLNSTPAKILSPTFWQRARSFHPEIIHCIPGPTIRVLMMLKSLKFACYGAKTVASATQPNFSSFSRKLIPLFKPDMVLPQSSEAEELFTRCGCQTRFLPNGVDTQKFGPVSEDVRQELRRKYRLPKEKFIILHVGPVKKDRNILIFNRISRDKDTQVIIVGSITNPVEAEVYRSLEAGGCLVWRDYLKNIEEIYNLSDCYVFPTLDKLNSIEMPLSVIEAMSCNLPVVSTKYGALPRVFSEVDGLYFVNQESDFDYLLNQIKHDKQVKTRQKILPYSWENVARQLEEIYTEILGQ